MVKVLYEVLYLIQLLHQLLLSIVLDNNTVWRHTLYIQKAYKHYGMKVCFEFEYKKGHRRSMSELYW